MNSLKFFFKTSSLILFIFFFNCSQDDHTNHNHEGHGHGTHDDKEEEHAHETHDDEEGHAHETHDDKEEEQNKFGESMAITWVDEQTDTFELSDRLLEIVEIKISELKQFKTPMDKDTYLIPKNAFVETKNNYGIYSYVDKKVKLIKVKLIKKKGNKYLVKSSELSKIKRIVLTSVPILRAAELQVFSEGGHGHSH